MACHVQILGAGAVVDLVVVDGDTESILSY